MISTFATQYRTVKQVVYVPLCLCILPFFQKIRPKLYSLVIAVPEKPCFSGKYLSGYIHSVVSIRTDSIHGQVLWVPTSYYYPLCHAICHTLYFIPRETNPKPRPFSILHCNILIIVHNHNWSCCGDAVVEKRAKWGQNLWNYELIHPPLPLIRDSNAGESNEILMMMLS